MSQGQRSRPKVPHRECFRSPLVNEKAACLCPALSGHSVKLLGRSRLSCYRRSSAGGQCAPGPGCGQTEDVAGPVSDNDILVQRPVGYPFVELHLVVLRRPILTIDSGAGREYNTVAE
jgi:hypothetical protein